MPGTSPVGRSPQPQSGAAATNRSIKAVAMQRHTKIILGVAGAAVLWPFVQMVVIAAEAHYIANGRPYCILAPVGRWGATDQLPHCSS